MLQKAENDNLPFFNLSYFEQDEDLPASLRKRITTLKKQLREDLKGRKSLRLAANSWAETIFNLRNALLHWFAQEEESFSGLLDNTQEMVHFFNEDDRFQNIAKTLQVMLVENEPVMKAMKSQGVFDDPEVINKKNAYSDINDSVMHLPDSLAQVILNGVQGTCYLEYVSIAVMDVLDTETTISSTKIKQLESIANVGLKQVRKFNTILLRSISEDEGKLEKSNYEDLSLRGLSEAYSVEEPEYDYSMLISRNPKYKG